MTSLQAASEYFESLFQTGLKLAESLPLERDFASMRQVTHVLRPAVNDARKCISFACPSAAALSEIHLNLHRGETRSAGMNTVGMLMDRLSILTMKCWALTHRGSDSASALIVKQTQVQELVAALTQANRGFSSINNKLTVHKVDAVSEDFGDSAFGLFSTNLLLWEAQELLYNRDITTLPCDELRAYISFFSEGNLSRNAFIQACDFNWWRLVDDK